jgi:hypothetical protein
MVHYLLLLNKKLIIYLFIYGLFNDAAIAQII